MPATVDYCSVQPGDPASFGLGDLRSMFLARAGAVLGPGFQPHFIDDFGAPTEVGNGGTVATVTLANVSSLRAGGGWVRESSSGAGSMRLEVGQANIVSGVPELVSSTIWDPYYLESMLIVEAFTGNAEYMACGLYANTVGSPGEADSGSCQYIGIGLKGSVSTTNWVVSAWPGGTGPIYNVVTTIPVTVTASNTPTIIGLVNSGLGHLTAVCPSLGLAYTLPSFPYTVPPTVGALCRFPRSKGGTTTIRLKYYAGASVVD